MVPLSAERRQDLLARAQQFNQIIIEDGYDSQLIDEAPQQALKSLDRSGRVIYVGSMSKTLAPGLRLGYIVASADLITELRALRRFMLRHPPANNQRAVALFLSLGHHEALVRRLSAAFDERRKRLVQAISAFLPEWRSTDSAGGTSLWLEGPRGTDARGAGRGGGVPQRHHRAGRPLLRPHRQADALHAARHLVDRAAAHRARHPRARHGRRKAAGRGLNAQPGQYGRHMRPSGIIRPNALAQRLAQRQLHSC